MEQPEKLTTSKKYLSSLSHYAHKETCQLSLLLRKRIDGYNDNADHSITRIKRQRQDYLNEYKEFGEKEDQLTAQQLRQLDPIYRLIFQQENKQLKELLQKIKEQIKILGIQLPNQIIHEDQKQSQYDSIRAIHKIFRETNTNEDESFFLFKRNLQKEFETLVLENDHPFYELQRLLQQIEDRKKEIMICPIRDEKDPNKTIFEFGLTDPLLTKYVDSFNCNLKNNKIDFMFGYGEQNINRLNNVFISQKNYIREFYEKYKQSLMKRGGELWQFFLFHLLELMIKKDLTNEQLENKLNQEFENNNDASDAVTYLIQNRKEMVMYLYRQNFKKKVTQQKQNEENKSSSLKEQLQKQQQVHGITNHQVVSLLGIDETTLLKESNLILSKVNYGKQQPAEFDHQLNQFKIQGSKKDSKYSIENEFTELDFLKMEQSQLVRHIPTLQKIDEQDYMLIRIEPMPKLKALDDELIHISATPTIVQRSFEGVTTLNLMQSKVYKIAYGTDENVLLSAPTGAGKTNVALLAILREIEKHIDKEKMVLVAGDFKIVYISPMKALASEIVEKFSFRLNPFQVKVKELTGDMQLTRTELEETQVIVTTPEKWDVMTRKNNSVSDELKLLIIDEIHLLNDERGPVLECLVARTLQHIERAQRSIRLLGLSATLPNYLDVAAFLHVKRDNVFFFDQTHRPVPLLQKFIGVKEPKQGTKGPRRMQKPEMYNQICYDQAQGVLEHHKQLLVFVHARKETVQTALYFLERADQEGHQHRFKPLHKDKFHMPKISDKVLGKLAPYGLGFHHAGMLRRDRNIVEKMFLDGNIRVLVATSTLAWGINLPAYSVIIKGTEVYDASRGGTQNLSILDVQQMFGRAGRPQFDKNGEATLITDISKVNQYMGQLNNASFLESKLTSMLKEAINAEIVLGNITNQYEAFDWINHSFFSIRLRRNPIAYGCRVHYNADLETEVFLRETLERTLDVLDKLRLIRFDRKNGYLNSTDLGRITSHYYVKCDTMDIFCKSFGINLEGGEEAEEFQQKKSEYKNDLQILMSLAQAKEFENIKLRQEEIPEIKKIIEKYWALEEKPDFSMKQQYSTDRGFTEDEVIIDTPQKVIALINGYLFKLKYDNFSLVSDSQFVVQNSIRLLRCLLEMSMKKNMAFNVEIILKWCKLLENRIVPGESPLRQFCKENFQGYNAFKTRKEHREGFLSEDLVIRIEDANVTIPMLKEYSNQEIANLIAGRANLGAQLKQFANYIPQVKVTYQLKPIAQTVLKMDVLVTPDFQYNSKWHSKQEVFWIYVDNEEEILHMESFTISCKNIIEKKEVEINFFLPYRDSKVSYYRMTVTSDVWITAQEYQEYINLKNIIDIKGEKMDFTELLDLQPLPVAALHDPHFEKLYPYPYFNPNQTQVFHAMFHTEENVLIGSPTGSGKTIMCEFAVLRALKLHPGKKIIYVAPLKALAKERLQDWTKKFSDSELDKEVYELTGDFTPDLESLMKADILITTPEKWDGISRNWNNRAYVQKVCLVIFDEIHLLGQDRGPVIEVIVSRMNLIASKTGIRVRMVGLSTAMANGSDVAEWFGVPKFFFFNFRPHIRPIPITIYFDGFSEKQYCPRMATMNKPCFNAIKKWSDDKPVLIFVSSRRQTRITALDLIAFAMHETGGAFSPYVKCSQEELDVAICLVKDEYLIQTLSFGIGMHHAGLTQDDRKIVEELFITGKIQVLIATSTLAWGVNFPARLVIIKGTEFFDPKSKRYVDMPVTDILQMIGRAGRPQFDTKGIACVFVEQSKKNFYRKYLNDPFPIESQLISQLYDHFNAEISCGTIGNKQQCLDWITYTYFFRRLLKNPAFYGMESSDPQVVKKFMIELVDNSIKRLQEFGCIKIDQNEYEVEPTFLGNLASFFYIKHETVFHFDQKIQQNSSLPDLIRVIAYAKEYEEVPLRHNEENLNEELSQLCPLKCNKKAMDSSQEKTYLLFQAHLFRLPLPIRDYLTDTKIVIDGCIRIVHATIDLAAEKQYLKTTLKLMLLMQMMVQGLWYDQCALINIPHFTVEVIKKLGFNHLCELTECHSKRILEKMLNKLSAFNNERHKIKAIIEAIEAVPVVIMNAQLSQFDSEKLQKQSKEERKEQNQQEIDQQQTFNEGDEAIVSVNLRRENYSKPQRVAIQATSKIKDASWWVLIGNEFQDKVLALKKVYFKSTTKRDFQIQLPNDFQESPSLKVFLISDSYLGMDQIYELKLIKQHKHKKENKDTKETKDVWL